MAAILDDFNRSNGDVGTTNWDYHTAGGADGGALQISSNELTTADNIYRLNLYKSFSPANAQEVSVKFSSSSGFYALNLLIRGNGSVGSLGGYLGQIFSDGTCNILELTTDTESTLVSGTHTIAAGDIFSIRAIGSALTLHKNGAAAFLSTTDASHASGKGGVGMFRNASTILIDDFRVTELGGSQRVGGCAIGNLVGGRLI